MKTVADKILPGNVVAFELSKTDLVLEGYSASEVVVTMFSDSQGVFEDRLVLESDLLPPFEVRCGRGSSVFAVIGNRNVNFNPRSSCGDGSY